MIIGEIILNTFIYFLLVDRGAWWAEVHGVVKSWTQLSAFTFTFHFHALEKEMATHSSVLAWGLRSMGSHRVGYDRSDLAAAAVLESQLFCGHPLLSLRLVFPLISALQVTFQVHFYYFNDAVGSVKSIVCCSCFSFYLSPSISGSLSYKLLFSSQSKFLAAAALSFVGCG